MSANLLNPYITFARNEGLRRGVSIWQSNNTRDILETAMIVNTNLQRQPWRIMTDSKALRLRIGYRD